MLEGMGILIFTAPFRQFKVLVMSKNIQTNKDNILNRTLLRYIGLLLILCQLTIFLDK